MRRSLALLLVSGLLPTVALGGAFGFVQLRAQRSAVLTGTDTIARFGAALLATKLDDGMHAVEMIAQSPAFDGELDARRFRTLALRIRGHQAAWRTLSVADIHGRRLLDAPAPIGGRAGGWVVDPKSLAAAISARRPVVGDVVVGPHGGSAFAVRAPVVRDGHVRYVISAIVSADAVGPLLRFRTLPAGWRAAVVDGSGHRVAGTSAPAGVPNAELSEEGRRARDTGRPGLYEFTRGDGTRAVGTWAPIAGTRWSMHVTAPKTDYSSAAAGSLVLLASVGAACLALAALFIRMLSVELRQVRAQEAAETQRQRMEALGRLTGGVAHDFNNLLTPILGGLDLIRPRVASDPKTTRHIDAALACAERARALVARLLAYSRRQALTSVDIDVGELIEGSRVLLEQSVAPIARLEFSIPSGLPPVRADRTQLELAILNLAINARDAMPEGGAVRISVATLMAERSADLSPGHYVTISVADSGTGMDVETLRQAIDPFFTTKAAEKGTGLGLSMVHGFAAQSGGVLRLESVLGEGTVATIILPQSAAVPTSRPARVLAERHSGRILLVDDDERVRLVAADVLMSAGFAVVEAGSIAEAFSRIADGHTFDAVVTDYIMPGGTGAELIRELRRTGAGMPIMLITGFADAAADVPEDVPRLAKPFRAAELIDGVATLVTSDGDVA